MEPHAHSIAPRVLVVEDDAALSEVVRTFLGDEGYACAPAFSGTEALLLSERAAEKGQPFDLVILDLMLPGVPGEELIGRLRAAGVDAPVIVTSAKGALADRVGVSAQAVCKWENDLSCPDISLLPQLARTFQEEHPGVEVRVRIANGELLRRDLLENRLDLALLEGEENGADLMLTPFAAGEMALIVPPGHPLARAGGATLAQAAAYPLLLRETGSATRRFLDQLLMSRGLAVQPVWESASTQALLSAVREGLGITLVPWALARQTVLRGEAERCPVTDAELIRRRYVAWHPSKYVTGTMRAFVNLCMEQAKNA